MDYLPMHIIVQILFHSVQFSHSVISKSLQPHGLQHSRHRYPSPTPGASSNSCPSSQCIQPSHFLSSHFPPVLNLSQHHGLFQWVSSSHQVAKIFKFQLQHQSFRWILRTDCFRIFWFDCLVIQRTLKTLLQHHNSKASIFQHSAFFIVQLSCL